MYSDLKLSATSLGKVYSVILLMATGAIVLTKILDFSPSLAKV